MERREGGGAGGEAWLWLLDDDPPAPLCAGWLFSWRRLAAVNSGSGGEEGRSARGVSGIRSTRSWLGGLEGMGKSWLALCSTFWFCSSPS